MSPFDAIAEQTRSWRLQVGGIDLRYEPDFLDVGQADEIFARLHATLPWEQHVLRTPGGPVPVPRRISWHADAGLAYKYGGVRHDWRDWTPDLVELRRLVELHVGCRFNAVLANLYVDERSSVAMHADDEPDMEPDVPIASVSLGATRDFVVRHNTTGARHVVPLEHGSLLVMADATQRVSTHGIPKSRRPCGPRINLTFRTAISPRDSIRTTRR